MTTHYYTASSLDGFIATADHSLDWLMRQQFDDQGPMSYKDFIRDIGALVMGSSTYEWVMRSGEPWAYTQPTWVMSTRELEISAAHNIRLAHGDVRNVHAQLVEAAAGKDVWIVGGGELAGQFADAGLLDEVWIQYAPVMLGSGARLLPRMLDLELIDFARNKDFLCSRFRVIRNQPVY